jgi:hypothetical protein
MHHISAPNLIKHTLKDIKSHINPNTVVMGDFNTHLSAIDRSSRKKNQQRNPRNKSHHRSNRPDRCLRNILPCNRTIRILLSSPETFSKIDNILGHKASLNKYNPLHTIWSQYNKTRTQQQKQQQKIHKQLKAEQHIAQRTVDYRRNKGGNLKVPEI